jgi:hypothetical protein
MLRRAAWVASLVGLIGLAFTSLNCSHARVRALAPPKGMPPTKTAPAVQQTIIGMVRAPDAPEAATVEVGDMVYKVVKDDNGKTVAREAKDKKAEIKGTVEERDGVKWITVLSAKLGAY